MPAGKSRTLLGASAAVVMVLGLGVTPAFADDPPPLDWTAVAGYPKVVDGLEITWQTASAETSPFGQDALLDPVPVIRVDIANVDDTTRYVGLGTDFVTQGAVDHLWTPEAWGAFDGVLGDILDMFWIALEPGEALSTSPDPAATWHNPLPMWSGHTLQLFELSGPGDDEVLPLATALDAYVIPGRFVGANLDTADLDSLSGLIGKRASVVTDTGAAELFTGVTASVTASGLTPGETLELWIAPGFDYFYFTLLGGVLPATAIQVGSGTVLANGTLDASVVVPPGLQFGDYQLVAGVRAERYWPAGTYGDFLITHGPEPESIETDAGAGEAAIGLADSTVTTTFPASYSGGTMSAFVSSTGPVASGFQLASWPPLYYNLTTTGTFSGMATVCIEYDPESLPGGPFRLYHFDSTLSPGRWVDITVLPSTVGSVCGVTSSFSPFVLGYPETFDFEGFFEPVSNDGLNVAKAGQAIPVKFSLSGESALDVVTSARFIVEGTDAHPSGEMLDAVTAGKSGLSYDARTDRYTFVWKTEKSWALKTGRFVMGLSDGTTHEFEVSFKK